jgi:hypothetical protein
LHYFNVNPPTLFSLKDTPYETYHCARFVKGTRYYQAEISQDLLDDWIIRITNGRINSRLGRSRTLAFQNFNEAFEQLCSIAKIRYQRGYRCTAYKSDSPLYIYLVLIIAIGTPIAACFK